MKIAFTGGGTGGHVSPGIAIYEDLKSRDNFSFFWIGSHNGIEKDMVSSYGIEYKSISTGKMRRYFSFKNFFDIFKVIFGIFQSYSILFRKKPDLIFACGGFVCVPPVIASKWLGIPIVIHNSDYDPGLATKICHRYSTKTLIPYQESLKFYKNKEKVFVVGNPIKKSIKNGKKINGLNYLEEKGAIGNKDLFLSQNKKVLLISGGSLGADELNLIVEKNFEYLSQRFFIIHQTGKNDVKLENIPNVYYRQDFFSSEFGDILDLVNLSICRSGANTIWEFAYKKIPMILVPFEVGSRGDQIKNAQVFKDLKIAFKVESAEIEEKSQAIKDYIENIQELNGFDNVDFDSNKKIISIIYSI